VYGPSGTLTWSSSNAQFASDIGSYDFFISHAKETDRKMHIARLIRNPSSGEAVIPVSRRLVNRRGEFAGVVLALLSTAELERDYRAYALGQDGLIALNLSEGHVVARSPHLRDVDLNVSHTEIHRQFLSRKPFGTMVRTSPFDGVERQYGFKRLERYPLNVLVGISTSTALANWRAAAGVQLIVVAAIVLCLGGSGSWLILQVRGRTRAERQLRRAQAKLEMVNLELRRLAHQDGLTGLSNCRHFDEALQTELARAQRAQEPLTVLMVDVDYFKRFNDTYGHLAGDAVLCQVAMEIERTARRPGDVACRFGGEEFAVLLPATDTTGAATVAEDLRTRVGKLRIRHEGSDFKYVTLSVGIGSVSPGQTSSPVAAADRSLYEAKAAGRNQVGSQQLQIEGTPKN
jgi:diguanylate cyclase (GGDEF)-like protein